MKNTRKECNEIDVFMDNYVNKFITCLAFIVCCLLTCTTYAADDHGHKHILFISSYSFSWNTVPRQIAGIKEVLGDKYVINYEFMDTKNTSYSPHYKEFYEFLKYKLAKRNHYEGVIVGDDAAFNFVLMYQQEFFPGVPIVFEGVDNVEKGISAGKNPLITGVVEKVDYKRNLDLAQKILPQATRIVFILDNAENGLGIQKQLETNKAEFNKYKVEYVNSSNYTREELCNLLSTFDSKDIVFCVSMSRGKNGVMYTEDERYKILNQYANVPLFRLSTSGVGECKNILGGYVVSHKSSGKIAAKMLEAGFNGTDFSTIPVNLDTPQQYYFNWQVIKKYNLDVNAFPKEAIFINQEKSFVEKYYYQFLGGSIGITIMMLIFVGWNMRCSRLKLKEANNKLQIKNRELEQAGAYKSDFFARMSHDIRTPLNAVIGFTSPELNENVDDCELKSNISKVHEAGKYLLSIINDVLDMSKIARGETNYNYKKENINEFFSGINTIIGPFAASKGVVYHIEIAASKDKFYICDKAHLEQIFINLLNNAVKFTPRGGMVSFNVSVDHMDEEKVYMKNLIKDTGIGMSEQFIPNMFESFLQENEQQEGGVGLGLAIVKHLVDGMHGTIAVKSKKGIGTEFTVIIPLTRCDQTEQLRQKEGTVSEEILKGARVLVCEDQLVNRLLIEKLLKKKDAIVEVADNGKQGVEMFTNSAPYYYNLILMDIRMPVMDGLEATRTIRKLNRTDAKTVPIIAMSANAFNEDTEKSLAAGMNAHISKPIEINNFYQILASKMLANPKVTGTDGSTSG